jgi:hypothetical protein
MALLTTPRRRQAPTIGIKATTNRLAIIITTLTLRLRPLLTMAATTVLPNRQLRTTINSSSPTHDPSPTSIITHRSRATQATGAVELHSPTRLNNNKGTNLLRLIIPSPSTTTTLMASNNLLHIATNIKPNRGIRRLGVTLMVPPTDHSNTIRIGRHMGLSPPPPTGECQTCVEQLLFFVQFVNFCFLRSHSLTRSPIALPFGDFLL